MTAHLHQLGIAVLPLPGLRAAGGGFCSKALQKARCNGMLTLRSES